MGTSIKTVVYSCTALASLADNTLTNITAPTIYLPESSKVFRSCWLTITADDIITATGGTIGTRRLDFGLAAVAQTTYTNANAINHSGENISLYWSVDVTSYFTTNWTGTSMAANVDVLIDQNTGTTLGQVNVCVSIHITYEYDDTSTTQVKTVWLPLNAPVGALAGSKPGSATATIPALDTHLPEASKTYRQIAIWRMGNTHGTGTDPTVSMEIESDGASTCAAYESALSSSRWTRYIDTGVTAGIDTSVTQAFYIWVSTTPSIYHPQVMLQVTYEFDASAANDVFVSLMLPANAPGALLGSTQPLVASVDLHIPESGISSKELAFYATFCHQSSLSGLNMRIGTGSYVTYTDAGSVYAGHNAVMVRNDSAYTLAAGKNTLAFWVYANDPTTSPGNPFSGFFVANYTCDKPSGGHGAVTHTVTLYNPAQLAMWSLLSGTDQILFRIPESSYRFAAPPATALIAFVNTTNTLFIIELLLSDGAGWRSLINSGYVNNDSEVGATFFYEAIGDHVWRWVGEPDSARLDPEATFDRVRARCLTGTDGGWQTIYTYHSQTFSAAGTVYGSAGGTVTLNLHLSSTGELLLTTSRVGNGAFSFTWFDPHADVYVDAYEDDSHIGRSLAGKAGTDTFDIIMGRPPIVRAA